MGLPIQGSGGSLSGAIVSIQADSAEAAEESKEVATHVHSYERWFAAATVPAGTTHLADRIGGGNVAFRLDGGAGAGVGSWGAWVQLIGSTDTPVVAGKVAFDFHKILLVTVERNNTIYMIQFGFGLTGAAALAANEIAEVMYKSATGVAREASLVFQTKKIPSGTLVWGRCWAVAQDTGTVDFYLGLHEYDE